MSKVLLGVLRGSIRTTLRNEWLRAEAACNSEHVLLARNLSANVDSTPSATTKKKKEMIKITLFQQNQISVTTLEEAQKLARRRDLKLLKMQDIDPKSQRPVYRLATAAELLAEDSTGTRPAHTTSTPSKKSEKSLTVNPRISDNDLASRLKSITKWLAKSHEIRVLIQGSNESSKEAERIVQKIEDTIKEPQVIGRITQKRSRDGIIRFNIIPFRNPSDQPPSKQA